MCVVTQIPLNQAINVRPETCPFGAGSKHAVQSRMCSMGTGGWQQIVDDLALHLNPLGFVLRIRITASAVPQLEFHNEI